MAPSQHLRVLGHAYCRAAGRERPPARGAACKRIARGRTPEIQSREHTGIRRIHATSSERLADGGRVQHARLYAAET